MEEIKLNQTPVRTSRNYNINNIKLKDIKIPKEIGNFESLELKGKTSLVEKVSSLSNMELKYGVGVINKPNMNLQINIAETIEEPLELDFMLNEQNRNLVENIVINASKGIQGTVILKYETVEDIQGFHNGILKINADISITFRNVFNLLKKKLLVGHQLRAFLFHVRSQKFLLGLSFVATKLEDS